MEQSASMEHLPPELRAALELELDSSESLRWTGQPDPSRMFRIAAPLTAAIAVFFTFFGAGAVLASGRTYMELQGLVPVSREKPGWLAIVTLGIVGLAMLGGALGVAVQPFLERRRARRTVYAVTSTRVMCLRLSRTGRVQTNVVEPSHPLHLIRREHSGGIGTIYLYPRMQSSGGAISGASLTLVGVQNPREVERTIRLTFDPPGTK